MEEKLKEVLIEMYGTIAIPYLDELLIAIDKDVCRIVYKTNVD